MAWRDATEAEVAQLQGSEGGGRWRDATPEEAASFIKPGDVEARKKQLGVSGDVARGFTTAPAENKVREDITVLGEFGEGLPKVIKGLARLARSPVRAATAPSSLVPDLSVKGLLESPLGELLRGGVQTGGALLAPLTRYAARKGEAEVGEGGSEIPLLSKLYGESIRTGDVRGALAEAAINVAGPTALQKVAGTFKSAIKALAGPTRAQKLAAAETTATSATAAAEAKAASETAAAQARTQAASTAAEEGITSAKSSIEAARESAESMAEAAKRSIPSRQDLKAVAGEQLGEVTGAKFQAKYHDTRRQIKAIGDDLYDEALGPKDPAGKTAVDVIESADDQIASLRDNLHSAKSPEARKMAEDALAEYVESGQMSEQPTVREMHEKLIDIRAAKRAAQQARSDNLARKMGMAEDKITAAMEEAAPGVMSKLSAADSYYAKEYAPFFSKRSVTRAIAEKDPSIIAKEVIRPARDKKAVDTIERTWELIGDDPRLKQEVARSHLSGLVDEASKGTSFRESFVKQWDNFTNPSGNNNKVLRTAYGSDYDTLNAAVNQMRNTKPKDFDKVAESIVANTTKRTEPHVRKLTEEAAAAQKGEGKAVSFAEKARDLEIKAVKKQLEADIEKVMGKPGRVAARLESIGSGVLVSGSIRGNVSTASTGGIIILGAKAASTLLQSVRGRSLWKSMLRNTPGTAQAAATARLIQNFLREGEDR